MADCLGIYFDNNIVKYAKLTKNNAGAIEIKEHGIRFVRPSLSETLEKVLNDVNSSKDIPVVVSAPDVAYSAFQVFKQISNNDLQSVIKLEFEDWCEKNGVGSANLTYVFMLATAVIGDYRKGLMAMCNKQLIEQYAKIGEYNVSKMYPADLLMYTDVPEEEQNYILVNMDNKLTATTVLSGKIVQLSSFDVGMKPIFDKFIDVLGSYEKAYEACKQLNVFSDDGADNNRVQLEEIVEPIFQDILHNLTDDINKHKDSVSKIFLTGSGILFTNIDTLFTEYFGIRCEILKPKFITDVGGVRNIAETLEVLPAIALAKEYLTPATTGLEFFKKKITKDGILQKIFGKKKTDDKKGIVKQDASKKDGTVVPVDKKKLNFDMLPKFTGQKIAEYAMYPIIVGFLAVIAYYVFSNIYMNQINKMKSDMNAKISQYEQLTTAAKSDKSVIDAATNQYKSVNDQVATLKQEIETNQIGKYQTYNVAAFTQKLIKVIPKDVQLKTISSDDNKNVKIVAQAAQYPSLGYFVASLRLQPDILTNVTINSVNNSDVVTIEIGGVLP